MEMKYFDTGILPNMHRQYGMVLVLSLLILLVLTVLGVAAMNSTMMQERMAGNTRTQTLAFEEASAGVSRALDYYYDEIENAMTANSVSDPHGYGMACGFRHGGDDLDWEYPTDGTFQSITTNDRLRMEQRMYCCQNWVYNDVTDECFETPSTLYVLSKGSYLDDSGGSLAAREIEVRLQESDPADPTCAICLPGNVGTVDPPNAGGGIHGGCGPAITVESQEDASSIEDVWGSSSNSELRGGVAAGDMGEPWNNAVALAEFVFWAKLGGDFRPVVVDYKNDGDIPNQYGTGTTQSAFGSAAVPHITYFDNYSKPVKMHSNPTGAGLMIIRGEADWGGTPSFDGLIVILGGKYEAYAGGGGGGLDGSMVVADLEVNVATGSYDFLGGPEVLQYPVLTDGDGNIQIDDDGYPVLEASATLPPGNTEVYYDGHSGGDPTFTDEAGNPLTYTWVDDDIVFGDPADPFTPRLEFLSTNPARDKYGRLIPDFVKVENWPPIEYGYSPNEWRWDPPGATPFVFTDDGSDIWWTTGGGSQAFNYDCRMLHKMRHRLLCEEKNASHDPNLNVDDDFYKNPDHSLVCDHSENGYEYGHEESIANQFAWHVWKPSCDCMGITVDTDMIISGWRENLGWRDQDDFVGCESFAKELTCPAP